MGAQLSKCERVETDCVWYRVGLLEKRLLPSDESPGDRICECEFAQDHW